MEITKYNITRALAIEQLTRLGIPEEESENIIKVDGWYFRNQWPSIKLEQEFRTWAVKEIKRVFQLPKKLAEKEYSWFHLCYGLKSYYKGGDR